MTDENENTAALITALNDIKNGMDALASGQAELSTLLAVLTERVDNIKKDQERVRVIMEDLNKTKREVGKNTAFRKTFMKVFWIIISVVVTIVTGVTVYQIAAGITK